MDRLGVGYEAAREVNPGIIYASISGLAVMGPIAKYPCVDPVAQAMGGLMSLTDIQAAPIEDRPSGGRCAGGDEHGHWYSGSVADEGSDRRRTAYRCFHDGRVFAVLEESVIRASMTGNPLPARGNTDPWSSLGRFPTKDNKWVMVCAANEDHLSGFSMPLADRTSWSVIKAVTKRLLRKDRRTLQLLMVLLPNGL